MVGARRSGSHTLFVQDPRPCNLTSKASGQIPFATACEHGKQLTWWWGRFHMPSAQGSIPWLATTRRVVHLEVIAASRAAGAGFDSLARYRASR